MRLVLIGVLLVGSIPTLAQPRPFEVGQIYIRESFEEGCVGGMPEHILGIDSNTGETWVFADQADGLCGTVGLVFTPDGTRLRASQWLLDEIFDFNAVGDKSVVYRRSDGINNAGNDNGMAFDSAGNFYTINDSGLFELLVFPGDAAPPTVIADLNDGIMIGRGIAVGRDGAIYCAQEDLVKVVPGPGGSASVIVLRVYPGNPNPVCVTFDQRGNLFVGVDYGPDPAVIHRYPNADMAREEVFATLSGGFGVGGGPHFAMALSHDESVLYVVDQRRLYAINVNDPPPREPIVIYSTPDPLWVAAGGIAVYRGPQVARSPGDMNCDGSVNAFDVDPFILALSDADEYAQTHPACDIRLADTNSDGSVNQFDIQPFVELLTP